MQCGWLSLPISDTVEGTATRERLEMIIVKTARASNTYTFAVQPIVRLVPDTRVGAYELLVRDVDDTLLPEQLIACMTEEQRRSLLLNAIRYAQILRDWSPIPLKYHVNAHIDDLYFLCTKPLDLSGICIEVVEGDLTDVASNCSDIISFVHNCNGTIAIDDYGCTKWGETAVPIDLEWDLIKLDRSALGNRTYSETIRTSTVAPICVEGVESQQDLEWARSIRAEFAQGFYYGIPFVRRNAPVCKA